jgi:hypothetical protein
LFANALPKSSAPSLSTPFDVRSRTNKLLFSCI